MKRHMFVLLIVLTLIFVPSALAESCPSAGPGFGHHISTMTPDCAKTNGQDFGKMVSNMARGIPCT